MDGTLHARLTGAGNLEELRVKFDGPEDLLRSFADVDREAALRRMTPILGV
jgi:hypothetical protein